MTAPRSTIKIVEADYTVDWTIETLERIEATTGRSVTDIAMNVCGQFVGMTDPDESRRILASLSLTFVRAFLRGAIGPLATDALPHRVYFTTFVSLLPGFVEAVSGFIQPEGSAAPNPPAAASAGSAPGPGLNSECPLPSSEPSPR